MLGTGEHPNKADSHPSNSSNASSKPREAGPRQTLPQTGIPLEIGLPRPILPLLLPHLTTDLFPWTSVIPGPQTNGDAREGTRGTTSPKPRPTPLTMHASNAARLDITHKTA